MPPIGLCAQIACVCEATARKPGNVHRFLDFDDVGYVDFLLSAAAVAPVFDGAGRRGVGATVLEALRATRAVVATNTNLGIVLLLAPLAAVPPGEDLRAGLAAVLDGLTVDDAREVYAAIRLAQPGGLGQAPEQDVRDEPTEPLRAVMRLAADRDLVARQYAHGFREVFDDGVPALLDGYRATGALEGGIVHAHLHLLARHPDSLIARKRGPAEAAEASARARDVLAAGWPGAAALRRLGEFDLWLRAAGRGRNPGTTADLLTACLFVGLREATITTPFRFPWPALDPRPAAGHPAG